MGCADTSCADTSCKALKISNFKLLPSGKATFLYVLLMVDFEFIRQECPFISFFFARLGVFLKYSAGRRPQAGLFISRFTTFKPVLLTLDRPRMY